MLRLGRKWNKSLGKETPIGRQNIQSGQGGFAEEAAFLESGTLMRIHPWADRGEGTFLGTVPGPQPPAPLPCPILLLLLCFQPPSSVFPILVKGIGLI
jgi:hypothetical protein